MCIRDSKNGGLSRGAIALGLVLGDLCQLGSLEVQFVEPRPTKSVGVMSALVTRLKGMSSAPADTLSLDMTAWLDSQDEQVFGQPEVKISEQAVDLACQWVKAFTQAELETVVDGSVWPAILAQLNGSDA